MRKHHALIVDDEADIRALLEITLSRMGLETRSAASLQEARTALTEHAYSLCLTDMRLPDGLGIELVQHIQLHHPETPVAVITAYGNAEDAVTSLKSGAFDFVTKPVDIQTLRRLVASALKNLPTSEASAPAVTSHRLSGNTEQIQKLRALIKKVARNQAPVHIYGESGTGKELVARMIHEQGPRANGPFIAVNCGAVPPELMESEFFGHRKGSFTGALTDNPGLFRSADGGTLFLDEVGDLPLAMQVKLLRAIQERKIRSVGSTQEEAVDVRIISATHKNLQDLVRDGVFRHDLYYRLNVIDLIVPPLRERRQDIPELCQELLLRIGNRLGLEQLKISPDALLRLQSYNFPGNIRELENILERAAALADDMIIEAEILKLSPGESTNTPPPQASTNPPGNIDASLAESERQKIEEALKIARYNKTKAAEILGISFRSLRYRLKKLNID